MMNLHRNRILNSTLLLLARSSAVVVATSLSGGAYAQTIQVAAAPVVAPVATSALTFTPIEEKTTQLETPSSSSQPGLTSAANTNSSGGSSRNLEKDEAKKVSRVDFYEIRRKSDSARARVDGFGLVIRTQIEGDHYVVNWALGSGSRADGNAKIDFEDALREFKAALQSERQALHQVYGDPKTQNELIFAADIIGRYELVNYTLQAIDLLSSFDASTEWALRSHVVINLSPICQSCTHSSVVVKLEHLDPTRYNWDISSEREVVRINVEEEKPAPIAPVIPARESTNGPAIATPAPSTITVPQTPANSAPTPTVAPKTTIVTTNTPVTNSNQQ